jgi:hypothetical protein
MDLEQEKGIGVSSHIRHPVVLAYRGTSVWDLPLQCLATDLVRLYLRVHVTAS